MSEYLTNGKWWTLEQVYTHLIGFTRMGWRPYTIGTSYLNRPIFAVRIGDGTKTLVINGCVHGNEKSGCFGILRFLNEISIREDLLDVLRMANATIVAVPILNPDGFVLHSVTEPGSTAILNGRGQNINADFPVPTGVACRVAGDCNSSELETQAFMQMLKYYSPFVVIDCHTGGISDTQPIGALWGVKDPLKYPLIQKTLNEANKAFIALNHTEKTSTGLSLNCFYNAPSYGGGTPYGGTVTNYIKNFTDAIGITLEFWRPTEKYANVSADFYLVTLEAFFRLLTSK